jgi:hypothetical protein
MLRRQARRRMKIVRTDFQIRRAGINMDGSGEPSSHVPTYYFRNIDYQVLCSSAAYTFRLFNLVEPLHFTQDSVRKL